MFFKLYSMLQIMCILLLMKNSVVFFFLVFIKMGTTVAQCLIRCTTNRKFASSILSLP
jgi:hypothetical protein